VLEASGITMESRSQTAPSPVPPRTGGGPNLLRLVEWLFGGWTLAIFLFFYIPIILLIAFSFNSSKLNVIWEGFTLKWYGALLQNRVLLETFKNSVIIAGVTTVVSTVLGTLGGWLLHRYRFPLAGTIGLLIFIPMVIPEVLMGVSLLQLFVQLKIPLGFTTVIIAHITFCFPFVVIAVQARLNGIDPFLEEAAMDLGARPWQAFFKVIVPYLMPAIISGALMSFTLSLDEYIVTSTTAGPNSQTLPLKVYGMAKVGLNPQLNALSTVFVVATVILVLISETINRLRDRKAWAQQ
jgi:spermidine/putrescine transport system permease protein